MKVCDVCKRTDRESDLRDLGGISSLWIGTTVDTCRIPSMGGPLDREITHESPVTCELCADCINTINQSIADHLQTEFGLTIRK